MPLLKIMHVAMCLSIAIYVVMANVINQGKTADMTSMTLLIALASISLFSLAVIPFIRKQMASKNEGKRNYFTLCIVTWALCQQVGVFGLIASLLYRNASLIYPFAIGALLALVAWAPKSQAE